MKQSHSIEVRGRILDELTAQAARELSAYFGDNVWQVERFDASAETVHVKRGDGSLVAMYVEEWRATVEASAPGLRLEGEQASA